MEIIDVWAQHPTLRLSRHEMFASINRWTGAQAPTEEPPLSSTLSAMDDGGVARALICAWYGPDGALISNDEVAACVAAAPDRLTGVASVDLRHPMRAVHELRHKVLFGTNYPMLTARRALAGLDELGLDAEARELFLSGNARRVFGLSTGD